MTRDLETFFIATTWCGDLEFFRHDAGLRNFFHRDYLMSGLRNLFDKTRDFEIFSTSYLTLKLFSRSLFNWQELVVLLLRPSRLVSGGRGGSGGSKNDITWDRLSQLRPTLSPHFANEKHQWNAFHLVGTVGISPIEGRVGWWERGGSRGSPHAVSLSRRLVAPPSHFATLRPLLPEKCVETPLIRGNI